MIGILLKIASTTSSSKGETLKDTIKMVSNYVDLIVMRHYLEGAARYATEVTDTPLKQIAGGVIQYGMDYDDFMLPMDGRRRSMGGTTQHRTWAYYARSYFGVNVSDADANAGIDGTNAPYNVPVSERFGIMHCPASTRGQGVQGFTYVSYGMPRYVVGGYDIATEKD